MPAPRRTPIELAFERELGTIAGRSWIVAQRRNDEVLVALDDNGQLAITELGANHDHGPSLQLVVVGDQLWVALIDRSDRETDYVLDLTTAHPARRAVPLVGIGDTQVAMSATRMLRHPREQTGASFELVDRARGTILGRASYTTLGVDSPWLRCNRDACFAITTAYDQRGKLEVVSFRFAADGTTTREDLGETEPEPFVAIADGERTRVAWREYGQGVLAVTLDASGHAMAPTAVPRSTMTYDLAWLPTEPPTLVYGDRTGWFSIDGHSLGLPSTSHLDAARTPDGMLEIAYSSEVTIDSDAAPSQNIATFAGGPPIDLQFGGRHYSWIALPLLAPGFVAAIVLEQGYGPQAGEVVTLRAPCR